MLPPPLLHEFWASEVQSIYPKLYIFKNNIYVYHVLAIITSILMSLVSAIFITALEDFCLLLLSSLSFCW